MPIYSENMKNPPILLNWPGGKRAIIKHLLPFIPTTFRHYYEPFIGGGAMFFTLTPVNASLSDANEELINCYIQVRDHPHLVIEILTQMKNTREDYYLIRGSAPTDPIERAARFIYLMTLSFNGLHRVNKQGKFNVPYNNKTHLNPCDSDKISQASRALSSVSISHCDFEQAIENATYGDFIYFDPPYTISANPCSFVKYNEIIFSWKDQVRLAQAAYNLATRGCHVLISNAKHNKLLELYQDHGFHMNPITRFSAISAKSKHRGAIVEYLFYKEGETYVNPNKNDRDATQTCKGKGR